MELLPEKWQVPIGTELNLWDSLVPVMYTVYYWKIDNNWLWFVIIFAEIAGLITIIATLFLPESPKFLISKKRFDDARKTINFFKRSSTPIFNGVFDREVLETYGSYTPLLGGKGIQNSILTSDFKEKRHSVVPAPETEKLKA